MRATFLVLFLLLVGVQGSRARQNTVSPSAAGISAQEQELLDLSRTKWIWMAERKADTLAVLFHDDAVFVHVGGTMSKDQELGVIRSGGIHYKQADIHGASVRTIGDTGIVLNTITLLAVVGGNEVTNPFEVTEVYVREDESWKLAVLAFTRLLR